MNHVIEMGGTQQYSLSSYYTYKISCLWKSNQYKMSNWIPRYTVKKKQNYKKTGFISIHEPLPHVHVQNEKRTGYIFLTIILHILRKITFIFSNYYSIYKVFSNFFKKATMSANQSSLHLFPPL